MATLVRWEPFRELASLQSELSRYVNGLVEGNGRTMQSWVPALDVWENESELVYAFDLPGVPEEAIQIEVADDTLTVSAERTREEEQSSDRYYRFERRFGSFSRAVGLPQGVDESRISATYKDGVVEIHVPKPEEAKPRKIQLGSAPADLEGSAA
ncbi:Molecular chaperone (small heat shock protein) [Gaiella occulta]|uniref:Molecular chaperone (Small heat shock protein) n=1 Tax=Gaiella occulta TaxID=1002870 RepID=A0A7M2YV22_9ACTN|nr:Hsp20/alpha crystallin family protein [Gaiella occulta]RDI73963.1 Molecular chaperone (small heat shock protein) [Gaiella occulta]